MPRVWPRGVGVLPPQSAGRRISPLDPRRELTRAWLRYPWQSIGYAYTGHWPTYRSDPAYRSVLNAKPPDPPPHLNDVQIAKINVWLGKRGWMIVRGAAKLSVLRTV